MFYYSLEIKLRTQQIVYVIRYTQVVVRTLIKTFGRNFDFNIFEWKENIMCFVKSVN